MPSRPEFERDWNFDYDAVLTGASFSGHERNKFFLNVKGRRFEDASTVSGLDAETDGRAFALFDYDRDGWQDIVLVNANAPLVELFRNRIGDTSENGAANNRIVALRFVGSSRDAQPTQGKSNRDGIGALAELRVGDLTLRRERRGGEGFAAQNSRTMIVGLGANDRVDALTVRWPSGVVQELGEVEAGTLVTVFEDPSQAPGGVEAVREPYSEPGTLVARQPIELPKRVFPLHAELARMSAQPKLVLYTTMATWCTTCLGELPHWKRLTEIFSPEELEIRAVPVDNADTAEKLERYVERHQPVYRLLETDSADVVKVNQLVVAELGKDALPASFVTDASGQVLSSEWGAPSVSVIRRLLSERAGPPDGGRLAAH